MRNRRSIIAVIAAAVAMFVLVYILTQPAMFAQPTEQMALPKAGGPTRRALAQVRTDALNARNEAPPVSEVEQTPVASASVAATASPANTVAGD